MNLTDVALVKTTQRAMANYHRKNYGKSPKDKPIYINASAMLSPYKVTKGRLADHQQHLFYLGASVAGNWTLWTPDFIGFGPPVG